MIGAVLTLAALVGLVVTALSLKKTRDELAQLRVEMRGEVAQLRALTGAGRGDVGSTSTSTSTSPWAGARVTDTAQAAGLGAAKLFAPLAPRGGEPVQADDPADEQEQEQDSEEVLKDVAVPDAGDAESGDTEALPWQMVLEPEDQAALQAADTANKPETPEPATPRVRGLEEALGAKVFVWIGGVALALAGAFMVKYSWDNQLLSVGTRLVLAAVFGGAMIGVGTWLRRRSERVATALVGAGVADLYGVTFAASSVYHFLGPVTGFVLLGLVTAGAVALSLRHGRFVALLGLVGGFCTPLLIGDARAADGPLLGYLLVLQIGLVVVTRQRGWIGLSAATLVGSVGWGVVQALTGVDASDRLAAGLLGMGSASVFVLNAAWVQAREQDLALRGASRVPISRFGLAVSAVGAAMALLGIVTVRGGYGPQELAMVGLLGAGAIALARLDRRYLAVPWLTLGLSAAMLLGSMVRWGMDTRVEPGAGVAWVALAFAVLYAVGGYLACWGGGRGLRVSAVSFASLAAVGGAVMLALGMAFVPAWLPRGEVLFGVAAVAYAAMALVRNRQRPHAHAAGPLGLAAWGGVTAAVAIAVVHTAASAWAAPVLAAALAVVAAGAAWSTRWSGLRHHGRWAAAWCALPVILTLLPASGWAWSMLRGSGGGAAVGGLAVCYGLVVIGLVVAVAGLRQREAHERGLRDVLGVLATARAATGAMLVVGVLFDRFDAAAAGLWHVGVLTVVLGAIAAGAHAWATRSGLVATRGASSLVAVVAGVLALLGLPWATHDLVVGAGLLWVWLVLVVVVMGLWALGCQRCEKRGVAAVLHVQAWGLLGWGVLAAVRVLFTGSVHPPLTALGMVEVAVLTAVLAALAPGVLALRRAWPVLDPADALRHGGPAVLGVATGVGVLGLGVVANPLLAERGIRGAAVFNTALLAYGLGAVGLAWAATAVGRRGVGTLVSQVVRGALGVSAALGVLGVAILIRHLFHPEDLRLPAVLAVSGETVVASAAIGFREYGVYALALLGAAAAATFVGPRSLVWAGPVAGVGVLVAVLGAGGVANPLRVAESVGAWPVLNAVLWVMLGPAALAGFVAWRIENVWRPLAGTLAGGAVLLAFGSVTLLVRQAFMGADLSLGSNDFGPTEWYAYSAAWLGLGVALLAAGVCSGRASLRYGSLAVLLLAVCKVFLLDTRHLDGLLRAGSFLGLGLTLMVLGYVYQRFVIGVRAGGATVEG